jgi:hypothetical protein
MDRNLLEFAASVDYLDRCELDVGDPKVSLCLQHPWTPVPHADVLSPPAGSQECRGRAAGRANMLFGPRSHRVCSSR